MNRVAASAICLAALLGASSAALPPSRQISTKSASLCGAIERVVYSCRFGRKTGIVCLGSKSVHYRFGTWDKIEREIASLPDWSNIHIGGNRSQAGLNQDHIRFTNGDWHYVMHAGETGPLNESPGKRFSGIAVIRGSSAEGETINLDCKTPRSFNFEAYQDLARSAPEGWDGWEPEGGAFNVIY